MRQNLFSILLAVLWLASCAERSPVLTSTNPPPTPTLTIPASTPTPTRQPPTLTRTSPPATATFTPVPTQSIPRDRPMIAFERDSSQGKRLVLVDPNGEAAFEFNFPAGALFATPFLSGLSPDARYFVYYEGGTLDPYGQLQAMPPDFELHILDLQSRTILHSERLLSPDFPKDLKRVAALTLDEFWFADTVKLGMDKLNYMWGITQQTMLNHLRTAAWSPDGSLLAFASQIPGPTSEMKFYDPVRGEAWNVNSELGHVLKLIWAPDSSAIALIKTLYDRHMRQETTHLLSRAGIETASISASYFFGWLGPHIGLIRSEIDFGDPFFRLKAVSVYDGNRTSLWEGSYADVALTPDLSSILVSSNDPGGPENPPGLFLKNRDNPTPLALSKSIYWKVAYWGSERFAFAASSPGGAFGVSKTGEPDLIDSGDWDLLASSNGKYLAGYGKYTQRTGLRVFDENGKLLATLTDSKITCLRWNAASTMLAYQVDDRLYVWEQAVGSPRLIAVPLSQECSIAWVNDH